MNGSLLDRVSQLERELMQAQSRALEAEAQNKVLRTERDELSKKFPVVSQELQMKEVPQQDVLSALLEIERFETLLRVEKEQRVELEAQLTMRQKLDVENGLSHSLEVSELERMNTMLAAENAALQEKMSKMQITSLQPSSFYKPDLSAEPCAEPEQDEKGNTQDSLTQWYMMK